MTEIENFKLTFDNQANDMLHVNPVWIEVWFGGVEIATIDWNRRQAVREFARLADMQLRAGKDVRTIPV